MRSNTSVLTCTLCPFRSNFQPAMALLSASHISPLTSNHWAAPSPDSNPCPLVSTGLNVLWTSGEPEPSQVCRNIFMHVREGGGIFFDTCQNHSCNMGTSLSRHTCSAYVSFKLFFSLIFLSFWLVLCPGALKSLCFSSAGLSRLPVSTHCCLSTNKAIE